MGGLIPPGTGSEFYRTVRIPPDEPRAPSPSSTRA
jgi:hypothetical protein